MAVIPSLRVNGVNALISSTAFNAGDGTAALPSVAQSSDPDNGLWFGTNVINFSTAGVHRWQINASGHLLALSTFDIGESGGTGPRNIYATSNVSAGAAGLFYWIGRSTLASPSDGVMTLANNATTDFARLQFGGTTSSFPALKRSTTKLQARLADDSAYATLDVLGLEASGVAGASFSGAVTNITVVNGIVTAAS